MSSNQMTPEKKAGLGKIFFCIGCCIVGLLVILTLFVVLMSSSTDKPPILLGYGLCLSDSDSVDKSIKSSSLLLVKDINQSQLKVGDIIAHKVSSNNGAKTSLKINKIIEINKSDKKILIKTDDEKSEARDQIDLIGKVTMSLPNIGKMVLFIKTPIGLIICVAFPLFLLLIFEIVNLIKLNKTQYEEDSSIENDLPSYMKINSGDVARDVFGEPVSKQSAQSKITNNYLFEQQDEELELVEPKGPFASISYKKPLVDEPQIKLESNSIHSTKEFELAEIKREVKNMANNQVKNEPVSLVPKSSDFSASINNGTKNNFNIEGIAVNVSPNVVNLNFDANKINRDISITVTNEYTNVIVNSDNYEVNFAFFKDETDKEQKVIIQKINKD